MEAATQQQHRAIEGEKAPAHRRGDALERRPARSGGLDFDHVAREARVSRGLPLLLRDQERLLAEVVRRDCELRMAALDDQLAPAATPTTSSSARRLAEALRRGGARVHHRRLQLSRCRARNEEIASEFAELLRRTREHVADLLARKQAEGALHLRAEPEAVADVLFSLADGICLRMLTETDHDFARTLDAGVLAVRALLD
jgi:AcrR family transcriptional regulator